MDLVRSVLGQDWAALAGLVSDTADGLLNMTHLALASSRYVNGVAIRHGEVSREMFPGYRISSITNGVHGLTWTARPFQELFELRLPGASRSGETNEAFLAPGFPRRETRWTC
jgi:starch phosphorylase